MGGFLFVFCCFQRSVAESDEFNARDQAFKWGGGEVLFSVKREKIR